MERNNKIKVLQAIADGIMNIECLEPAKFYVFREKGNDPLIFEMGGKLYTEEEYEEFCSRIERKWEGMVRDKSGKPLLKMDQIIEVTYVDKLKEKNNIN